ERYAKVREDAQLLGIIPTVPEGAVRNEVAPVAPDPPLPHLVRAAIKNNWETPVYSCWLLRGQRFLVGMGGGRKRLNILGAYCPRDQDYLDLRVSQGTISARQVIELLPRMQQRHPETTKFILYLDNARYQHARAVREWVEIQKAQEVEFVLAFLPAYSPN